MTQTTENDYLGGRVKITQPAVGYRAGVDPVLLAASVPAVPGQTVLELGTGVGTAALCLEARVGGLSLTGLELQPEYAALARANGRRNGAEFEVVTGDLAAMPAALKQRTFDHVIANPPYFDRAAGFAATDSGRETAMGEATPLSVWLQVAAKRVAPKGFLTFIHRAERLADLLIALPSAMGSIQVQPLQPRHGRDAQLLILRARHSGRAKLRLHAPIRMHEGDEHASDAEDYTPQIRNILRFGGSLPMPD
ncbi:methyltransferase domain-containing protein [Cognatishimia sp. SS12]|uniref:tRNA1(Val) (adenine(37)-N6)-methyltransferase n=1 Tax=Cognatishimia sp. SS12 TaxID=2979465 RepID=UPI002331370D|nr:methyltransferase domain-containing protein [Cognatishimia sp. SS12]MDC0739075.1 methyltransferase domain-containing protein [Cognatishimia sp. SS12]